MYDIFDQHIMYMFTNIACLSGIDTVYRFAVKARRGNLLIYGKQSVFEHVIIKIHEL